MSIADIAAAAQAVHRELRGGHTEATYHRSMEVELAERGIQFSSEGTVPIFYKGSPVGKRRPDLFIETDRGTVVAELKAGSSRGNEQLLQYLDLLGNDNNFDISSGILLQFNNDMEITVVDIQ